jgi:ketopantoate reductase
MHLEKPILASKMCPFLSPQTLLLVRNMIMVKKTTKQQKNSKSALIFNPKSYHLKTTINLYQNVLQNLTIFILNGQTNYQKARAIFSLTESLSLCCHLWHPLSQGFMQ